ncbi:hypothetical protein [Sagittula sp. S175]|uniref:hypothetical protein n=1 Tax=Sagittula sp. S175 TaxID=3415129 RepID=UPI003C7B0F3C
MAGMGFDDALTRLSELLTAKARYADEVCGLFRVVTDQRPLVMAPEVLRLFLDVCYAYNGVTGAPEVLPRGDDRHGVPRVGWFCGTLIEETFFDRGRDKRDWIDRGALWHLAMKDEATERGRAYYIPHYNVSVMPEEAAELAAPYLAHLERGMAEAPFRHLKLCWDVMQYPLPPFHGVFRDWLADMDRRGFGVGPHLRSLDRARGFVQMAMEGAQRVSWANVEGAFLPQMAREHPLVAAAIGRFLGSIYAFPEGRFTQGVPWGLGEMLDHLAGLPANRRVATGGFLNGYADVDDPFPMIHEAVPGFAVDDWVLRVLADGQPEPYLPSAQAFWFPVHEHYWNRPDFAMRLIDEGHLWEAQMCATEGPVEDSGMAPVLARLAALEGTGQGAR